jgi:hypothetical protein
MRTVDYGIIEYPIPLSASYVLSLIQQGGVPEAIVAGGCLRDAIMGRSINDIDVFVPEDKAHKAAFAIQDTHPTLAKSIPEPYFTFNNDVRSVNYYEAPDGWLPVNIIGVTKGTCTPEQQLERFDFGICRVAFDGRRLWKDLSFDRDQADETFTLSVSQTQDQRRYSMQRYERLQAKYNGWRFVDASPKPNTFEDF